MYLYMRVCVYIQYRKQQKLPHRLKSEGRTVLERRTESYSTLYIYYVYILCIYILCICMCVCVCVYSKENNKNYRTRSQSEGQKASQLCM